MAPEVTGVPAFNFAGAQQGIRQAVLQSYIFWLDQACSRGVSDSILHASDPALSQLQVVECLGGVRGKDQGFSIG